MAKIVEEMKEGTGQKKVGYYLFRWERSEGTRRELQYGRYKNSHPLLF